MLRYNGASLRYSSVSARGCPAPEGIAFACGHMYVARRAPEHAMTARFPALLDLKHAALKVSRRY